MSSIKLKKGDHDKNQIITGYRFTKVQSTPSSWPMIRVYQYCLWGVVEIDYGCISINDSTAILNIHSTVFMFYRGPTILADINH